MTDFAAALDAAIAEASASGVGAMPPGTYEATAEDGREVAKVDGTSLGPNLEIVCDGVELVCRRATRALTIVNATRLRLSGLTIDYQPLPFWQATIVEMGLDGSWMRVKPQDGFPGPDLTEDGCRSYVTKVEIFDESGELCAPTLLDVHVLQSSLDGSLYTLRTPEGRGHYDALGKVVVLDMPPEAGALPHAVVIKGCTDCELRDVCVHAASGFAFFEVACWGTKYTRCAVTRGPAPAHDGPTHGGPAHDGPAPARRLRSSNADAFHSMRARVGPTLERCVCSHMGDDGVSTLRTSHLLPLRHVTARDGM